jgi:hypothetical protein
LPKMTCRALGNFGLNSWHDLGEHFPQAA